MNIWQDLNAGYFKWQMLFHFYLSYVIDNNRRVLGTAHATPNELIKVALINPPRQRILHGAPIRAEICARADGRPCPPLFRNEFIAELRGRNVAHYCFCPCSTESDVTNYQNLLIINHLEKFRAVRKNRLILIRFFKCS